MSVFDILDDFEDYNKEELINIQNKKENLKGKFIKKLKNGMMNDSKNKMSVSDSNNNLNPSFGNDSEVELHTSKAKFRKKNLRSSKEDDSDRDFEEIESEIIEKFKKKNSTEKTEDFNDF